MLRFIVVAGALALAAVRPASADELADIRREIGALRDQYEARIRALEDRLKEAEARAAVPAPAPALAGPSSGASAFNPAMSAILTGTYAHLQRSPSRFALPGFAPEGEVGPGRRSFSLGESELILSANVDPHFAGTLVLAVSPEDAVGVEEAYGQLLTAPFGIAPKFGRFLSGVGYLNEQHAHAWDFVDTPLAYQAFFGGQYRTDGAQVRWVAPWEHFVELGAEAGNGDAHPGSARDRNGLGAAAFFAHTGGDVGASSSWRAGLSYLRTRAQGENAPELASRVAIADFVWKYAPQGNAHDTSLKLQGEYLGGRIRDAARQGGWYLQGVYQFMPQWRVGARYDRLQPRGVDDATYASRRSSLMLDYNPSEFSRVRVQFARAQLQPDFTDNQWFVQYILSLGAHGAHKY